MLVPLKNLPNPKGKMTSLPSLLNPHTPTRLSFSFPSSLKPSSLHSLKPPHSSPLHSSFPSQNDDLQDHVIGDCLVFEQGIFDDPYLETTSALTQTTSNPEPTTKKKKSLPETQTENLVPDEWREVQAEINITKKERRKIAQELEFNSRVERKRNGLLPVRRVNLEEYKAYREAKLAQLKPIIMDSPSRFRENDSGDEVENEVGNVSERVAPKNPRWAVYGRGFDDVNEFFNSGNYQPGQKDSQGSRKLFTKEEKVLLNKRIPDLAPATSSKWLPLHALAASGEFYLMDELLKHNVDINAADADGLTALHKAITCKKQAIPSFLLRESASPFVRDADGATLMHYAVQTASAPAIKLLLLYNVDINLQDNDGWTPLHLAVQGRRTDIVTLLLLRGADKTIRNKDGLTPLELCLHCGRDTRTYELVKRLKQITKKSNASSKTAVYNMAAS